MSSALAYRTTEHAILPSEVLYVAENSLWGRRGYETTAKIFPSATPVYWSPGMPKPDLGRWQGDWIIAFKADLVLARTALERARKGAINFHPSPPKYRGLGGYWWALHNGDPVFGVTVHHMDERIDHGQIIKTADFPILPRESLDSLKERTAVHALTLLHETLGMMRDGAPLNPSGEEWAEHLYTSRELERAQQAKAA